MKRHSFILISLLCLFEISGQTFTDVTPENLSGLDQGSIEVGDFNNDGKLDLLNTGALNAIGSTKGASNILTNEGDFSFALLDDLVLDSVFLSTGIWSDFNNDGHLDVFLSGSLNGPFSANMYFGNGLGQFFVNDQMEFEELGYGEAIAGDLDNDGDMDILTTGSGLSGARLSLIYYNNGDSTFEQESNMLRGLGAGSVDLADYDIDGDLDILVSGETGSIINDIDEAFTLLYTNNNGSFEVFDFDFEPIKNGDARWIDYNVDGFPDIISSGFNGVDVVSKVYTNANGTFSESDIELASFNFFSVAIDVGDINSDGYPDAILASQNGIVKIYNNDQNGGFVELEGHGLEGAFEDDVELADLDGDNDLDILMIGTNDTKIFRNDIATANASPAAPTNLTVDDGEEALSLSWDAGSDSETPDAALWYNYFIVFEGDTLVYPHSNANGTRRLVNSGNSKSAREVLLNSKEPGSYTFGVQTIDQTLNASAFAVSSFSVNHPPVITSAENIQITEDTEYDFDLSILTVDDPDNDFPADYSFTLFDGSNYEVVDGSILPNIDYNGVLEVMIQIYDGKDSSNVFTLNAEVLAVNDAPVIISVSEIQSLEDTQFEFDLNSVVVNDPDNDFPADFTFKISNGENYEVDNGAILPSLDFSGVLQAMITLYDGSDSSNVFAFTIEILPVNDVPVIFGLNEPLVIENAEPLTLVVDDFIITDVDTDSQNFSVILKEGNNYKFSGSELTPVDGFVGDLNANIVINDGIDDSEIFTFSVSVLKPLSSKKNLEYFIFPNPTSDFVTIVNPDFQIESISLTSTAGKRIPIDSNNNIVDMKELPNGIYFLSIEGEDGEMVTKRLRKK